MRKLFLAPLAALSVLSMSACDTVGLGQAPAPLASTYADEHYLLDAWDTAEFAAQTVDALRDSGKLVPGTPKALRVQKLLYKARDALIAASAARRALNTTSYETALAEARAALTELKNLIR